PQSVYEYAQTIGAVIYQNSYEFSSIQCFTHSYNIAMGISEYLFYRMQISYIPNLEDIRARARFATVKNDSLNNSYVVVDVAHNPASFR
ncbi:bifunctional folylpolyglutamate synthase/dihydrofolate synthase, partial [Francisella tularensis subsp. holarctica]|nr:bifunctional folylpolyglutamate synthase/dihydrofolate synthase [Francisella tularensis subsp. holarctica]